MKRCEETRAARSVPYQVQRQVECSARVARRLPVRFFVCDRVFRPLQVFLQGRHYEQMVDASALRADEGRGLATIRVGEPRAGCDPTISEWGNPSASADTPDRERAPGELNHLTYPEEETVVP